MIFIKIAKKIISDYIYDPNHLNNPGGNYHKTEKGWSNINFDNAVVPFYKNNGIYSRNPFCFCVIKPFLTKKNSDILLNRFRQFYKKNSFQLFCYEISQDVDARNSFDDIVYDKFGGRTNRAWNRIENLIEHYVSVCHTDKLSGSFSRLVGLSMGSGNSDWRMIKNGFKEPTNEMIKNMRLYSKKEQELLLHTGFVDKDGMVTIFRNTKHINSNEKFDYHGAFVESWSVNPKIQTSKPNLIMAKVPLEKIISSFVGRGSDWEHINEYEVLVESTDIVDCIPINEENKLEELSNKLFQSINNSEENLNNYNFNQYLENKTLKELEDIYSPTTKDIQKLKELYPESRKMSISQLIILFKTLMKNGYFDDENI